MKKSWAFPLFFGALTAVPILAGEADLKTQIRAFSAVPAVSGSEERMAAKIQEMLSDRLISEIDSLGSVYARTGQGESGLTVLAPLDEFGWFVSGMTPDGYLRLDRAVPPPHAVIDDFLMGHAVVILSRSGIHHGVVAQPAMHLLSRERRDELQKGIPLELVYVDVGARSEEEVKGRGIEYLDAVTFRPDLVTLAGDRLAGPGLGHRTVCAALALAAQESAVQKAARPTHFVWMAQSRFNLRGGGMRTSLGAARARSRLKPKTVLILDTLAADGGEGAISVGQGPVVWQSGENPSRLKAAAEGWAQKKGMILQHRTGGESPLLTPFLGPDRDVLILALPVQFSQTPSEIVSLSDVQSLVDLVVSLSQEGVER